MTHRQIGIAKAILQALHDTDGGQLHEISIHADANLIFRAMIPKNEFDEVFATLNGDGCFIGVTTKFKGTLWSISDKGEQTRQEMQ
jgi:hypothetical protein